jgi:hypothetical protein
VGRSSTAETGRALGGLRDAILGSDALWQASLRRAMGWLGPFAAGMGIGLLPYVALNVASARELLPSTYYAKAAFYALGSGGAAVTNYVEQVGVVLLASSPALLALVALSYSRRLLLRPTRTTSRQATRAREPTFGDVLAPLLWLWPLTLVAAYAVHLPVAYQHARYQMPALPPLLALAAAGAAPLLLDGGRRLLALSGTAVLLATGLLSMGRSAQIYAENVRYIDDFQVATAQWLRTHTPARALVATHDVGAIGYFAQRPVLDMSGLIDPQVVPLLGDQAALEAYLARRHVGYVAMFVDWFPPPAVLAHDLAPRVVFRASAAEFSSGPDSLFVVFATGW